MIFDLDGTLWDAARACTAAWNETMRGLGKNKYFVDEDKVRSFSGLPIETIFSRYFDFIPKESYQDVSDRYKASEIEWVGKIGGSLYPHVKEELTELKKNYHLFIVSNCLDGYINNFISFHGLQSVFSDFEFFGNTGLPKSENIRLIVERNNLNHPVYIGDTEWDHEAATLNSIPFIYAAYGFGKTDSPDWMIDSFEELRKLISPMKLTK
ncbi:MAG: HAD family hydrolase [Chitinophagales bacterium]